MPRLLTIACLCVLLGCGTMLRDDDAPKLDHILLGVPDLESAITEFQSLTGVTPLRGGRHPGRGTENALVALGGGSYLELIAPQPGGSSKDDLAADLRKLARPTPVGWALRVRNAAVREQLIREGVSVSAANAGSRVTPAGEKLEWQTFGLDKLDTPAAPFFIAWRDMARHPSLSAPQGCAVDSFSIADPAGAAITETLRRAGYVTNVGVAPKTTFHLTLRCGERKVSFHTD